MEETQHTHHVVHMLHERFVGDNWPIVASHLAHPSAPEVHCDCAVRVVHVSANLREDAVVPRESREHQHGLWWAKRRAQRIVDGNMERMGCLFALLHAN